MPTCPPPETGVNVVAGSGSAADARNDANTMAAQKIEATCERAQRCEYVIIRISLMKAHTLTRERANASHRLQTGHRVDQMRWSCAAMRADVACDRRLRNIEGIAKRANDQVASKMVDCTHLSARMDAALTAQYCAHRGRISDSPRTRKTPALADRGRFPSPCPRAQPRTQPRLDRRVIAVWQTRHGIGSARAARTLPTADCRPWRDPFGSSQVVVAGAAGQRPPRRTYRRRPVSRLLPAEPDAAASARGLTRQPLPAQLRGKLKKRAASYRGVTSTSSCKTM